MTMRIGKVAAALLAGGAFALSPATANLVSDPGFEFNSGSWATTGWYIDHIGRGAHTGINSILTGCVGPAFVCTFSQTLATAPGALYDISFWLYADGLAPGNVEAFPNGLQVSFDGVVVTTILDFPSTNPATGTRNYLPGGPSKLFTISGVLAKTVSTVLKFAGYHNPAVLFVDDVSVDRARALPESASVPEPDVLALLGLGLAALGFSRRMLN